MPIAEDSAGGSPVPIPTNLTTNLTGEATGSGTLDYTTGDIDIAVTVVDNGHNHILDNITDVQVNNAISGQVLKYNGNVWVNGTDENAGITAIVQDLSPQLGGNLDLNNRNITGTGNLDYTGNITLTGTVDGRNVSADGTKLDGIESGATADQTATQIKTAYESNSNTNAFTDADHTKLNGIETAADVTDTTNVVASLTAGTNVTIAADGTISATGGTSGIAHVVDDTTPQLGGNLSLNSHDITGTGNLNFTGSVTLSGTVDGRDVAADGTKLDGIEAGANITDTANVTAAGALMDSEVTNLAQVKAFNSSDYATAAQGTTADAALPKAGGTMTGNLVLSNTQPTITLTDTDGPYSSYIAKNGSVLTVDGDSVRVRSTAGTEYMRVTSAGIDVTGTVEFDGLSGTGSVTVTDILDEDNMASNSATKLATQQSIKAYVDAEVAGIPTGDITSVVAGTGLTGGGTSGAVTLNVSTLNQNTTGNAATATALQTARTIAGVSFNGTANIALNNNAITNGAGYTTNTGDITGVTAGTGLTGGSTSGTVTLNVSQGAGSGLDADTCDGLHVGTGRNNTANEIVRTDGSGYSQLGWINTTSGATSTTITRMYMGDNDGYIRYMSPANFFNQQASALLTAVKTVDGSGSGLDADTLDGVNGASYLRSDTTDYMNANLVFADNARLQIGTNTDLQLFHDGNDSYIREAGTGVLFMDSDDIHFRNGAGSNTLMQLSSDVLTMQGQLQMNGNIINDVEDIYLRDKMYHDGDTNTYFGFSTDTMNFFTGGTTAVTMNNNDLVCYRNLAMSGQIIDNVNHIYLGDRIFHHGDTDNYKQFTTDTQNFVTGGSTRLRLNNTGAIIYQDLYTPNKIIHSGDTDTYTQFHASNQWRVVVGNSTRLEVRTDGVTVLTTLTATGDVIAYGSSDKQLKDNIVPIANAMHKISKLSGNTFDWNDKQSEYDVGTKDVGVIAQEVEAVLPEVVTTRDNGYKAVRYEKMIALLIEGMKEQQAEIDTLKAKLGDM